MIARTLPEDLLPADAVPVIYLPGVSRGDIRAIEECPPALQPLAELQYRGVLWTQKNGSDWTLAAFLQSKAGGLGLELAGDQATREALKRALVRLADESIERLRKEAPLKSAFFDALLNPDEPRSLLLWLNDPAGTLMKAKPDEWQAFCSICKAKYGFHPEKDGPISAAQLLGLQSGGWKLVWTRFQESPRAYPNLPALLQKARPPQPDFFDVSESWPQDNDTAEEQLQRGLNAMASFMPQDARAAIADLELNHGQRRGWVWAALGRSPLALSLEPLASLAELTVKTLSGPTIQDFGQAYLDWGWQVDATALHALTLIQAPGNSAEDIGAVKGAVRALYKPWLEAAATNLQKAIASGPVEQTYPFQPMKKPAKGTCILFSDALRMDAGQQLAASLAWDDFELQVTTHLAALPPITSTAKFTFFSSDDQIEGKGSTTLTPLLAGKAAALTADAFRKLLEAEGFQVLQGEDLGDPSGLGWTEMGEIDAYGHEHGSRLAIHLLGELLTLRNRIEALFNRGWKQVVVVTDHGWLLLPGGLPKAFIPEFLTDLRKGRCARLKEGAQTDQQTVPWHWDADVRVAIAPGIHSYEAGKEYEHGGLSPQECITPVLTIQKAAPEENLVVQIENPKWQGLRFSAKISGARASMRVDIRSKAGDAATSQVKEPVLVTETGKVSLLVEDEDQQGAAAFIVVITADGQLCDQKFTTIGE